ncbi:Electron transfer DM13 OS=Tsukamurella paurometabola (strain ATCC 8368 / DSM / CCUG 35730 /CIP 100753 / JCM 10117 / KCTC 9821 / NBRC 16120 / NCIMB 702349/ NCTC 13040) OX=521096 GN=Tpau_2014 PE=4 SV=1 [Tsukamurella paurometabola]|uniref:Electron transfer DM13 n=1 Tax=Tsukamurella paurometabola (strain ATCC 8368 / DSM 20162 / CCUG 35730 / CIP 100753 / JCM 10117 / KCTC 9821 / NBRC 16120 / NCIMB 702349 / NCTC 13040) TaxID=521096 RepID=D5UNQ8_TSUPD|nr:DM13 domain-containing protein [Tsukamurella paurometabola]ADG78626.1 Electron transfer DM13 [Tsukamurella paurometabola DSM 20162]SUP32477.1 Electron transfer DM13 [Tsukamurella paurometabola]
MRITRLTGAATALVLGVSLAACGGSTQMAAVTTTSTTAAMSMSPSTASSVPAAARAMGSFEGLNDKRVVGTATITGTAVELAGFASDEGPDLHLYATTGTSEADVKAGVRLGSIAYDKASQRFTLPGGVSPTAYTHLVVHCDKALAVFGAARLSR